jgi:hypothetical protein
MKKNKKLTQRISIKKDEKDTLQLLKIANKKKVLFIFNSMK